MFDSVGLLMLVACTRGRYCKGTDKCSRVSASGCISMKSVKRREQSMCVKVDRMMVQSMDCRVVPEIDVHRWQSCEFIELFHET